MLASKLADNTAGVPTQDGYNLSGNIQAQQIQKQPQQPKLQQECENTPAQPAFFPEQQINELQSDVLQIKNLIENLQNQNFPMEINVNQLIDNHLKPQLQELLIK